MKKSLPILFSLFAFMLFPLEAFAADLTSIQETVSNYLPYILIGGAVILLVSIIGILLGKKKDKETPEEPIMTAQPATPEVTTETVSEPSVEATPVVEQTPEPSPMESTPDISNNLYATAPEVQTEEPRPSIQETLSEQPVSEQVSDMQAILQGEASAAPMTPVTDQSVTTPEPTPMPEAIVPPVTPEIAPTAVDEPSPIPPIDTSANAVPDLQQFINNQVEQVPPVVPTEAPMVATAPEEAPVPQDMSTPQTPMGGMGI